MTEKIGWHASKASQKIRRFESFDIGWNFGRGVKFSPLILDTALNIIAVAWDFGLQKNSAFPGDNGEVQLCFYIGGDYLLQHLK